MRGQIVASGVVTFHHVAGNTKQRGKKKIGQGHALVHLNEVLLPKTKPPILYVASQGDDGSWSSNRTIGDIMSTTAPAEIVVNTSSLCISLSCETHEQDGSDQLFLDGINNVDDRAAQDIIGPLNENTYLTVAEIMKLK